MSKPLHELEERLLRAGVAPRHVRRYCTELAEHWADLQLEERSAGRNPAEAASAALLRLGSTEDLAKAMIEQRRLQSWLGRAPWAAFGIAPLFLLAAAYFAAWFILWSGWQIFLPGTETPFVPIDGLAILYFGVGRSLYYGAPLLAGWTICLIAARQRSRTVWHAIGLVPIALLGAAAQVHAGRQAVPRGFGHIWLNFTLGGSLQSISHSLFHASVILTLTVLPYVLWRLRKARALFA